ncbi:MAG: type IX secretion system outer membrane channel protein PorV, partial [Bacteroidales bacterium]|nr:type IX secretion system outer membrane channel protein PorV [Bacteroidales bacterium]
MQTNSLKISLVLLVGMIFSAFYSSAQNSNYLGQDLNTITTAVPFLMIGPDARSGGMGEAGVSSSPDASSMHWNPAKYAFIDDDFGFSMSYSPWLRALVSDINLAYLNGFKRLDDRQTIAMSLLYFSLGDITFTDINGETIGNYKPNEFSIDIAYARQLGPDWSGAVAARYIYSNLTQGQFVAGAATHPGSSVAADVAFFYTKELKTKNMPTLLNIGVNVSNIGAKISYSDDNTAKDFIPTNLRFGPSLTMDFDEYNSFTFMIDVNKLLVPTPPIYDSIGGIEAGMDPDVSVVRGMYQSFYDAPGGFNEEMREFSFSIGL